ncbi:MAG: hypothetical protein ACPIOQ_76380 [Promethearchaeia archaeon]
MPNPVELKDRVVARVLAGQGGQQAKGARCIKSRLVRVCLGGDGLHEPKMLALARD